MPNAARFNRKDVDVVSASFKMYEVLWDEDQTWELLCDAEPIVTDGSKLAYHAITGGIEAQELPRRTLRLAGDLVACGIDPSRSILFVQSHVPEHTELAWVFSAFAAYGDLNRMTQPRTRTPKWFANRYKIFL